MTTTREARLTFEEYLAHADGTEQRYELVDGKLVPMNPPTFRHLLIAKFLDKVFESEITRLGLPWISLREAGVRTGRRKSRLTDLCVVALEDLRGFLNESAVCQSPPWLAVEIVSPDSVKRDYRYKRSEYAALEIPEYWIVDPMAAKVCVLLLEEGLYEESEWVANQPIVSRTFPDLSLSVEQVLAAGEIS